MKVSTIQDILTMEEGLPVLCARGKIVKLYKPKTGESDKGPWSFQSGLLSDGQSSVKFTLNSREELPQTFLNKQVVLTAQNGNHGWTGLKTKDEEYNGKVTRVLWVTPTADIQIVTEGGQPVEDYPPTPQQDAGPVRRGPAPHDTSAAPAQTPTRAAHNPVFGGTVGMCLKEACAIVNALGTDPFSPDYYRQVHEIASDLIRVSLNLEAGKLSPSAKERAAKPADFND